MKNQKDYRGAIMKRFVILGLSLVALVFCFSSCGEKALDPNYLPHDSNIKIPTNLADMVKKEKIIKKS